MYQPENLNTRTPEHLMIKTQNLNFSYGRRQILHNVNLEVPVGSIFGFLGPNGAGKTTTIKALLGLLRVKPGMVNIFGKDICRERIAILQKTGNMVEGPSLYDHLSGYHNLVLSCKLQNIPINRVDEVLKTVDMVQDAKRPVKQYSTGMKQRLSLAVALLSKPELLILDEPINGLDPSGIIEIRQLLKNLNQHENCTVFLSSHILGEIEKLCTDIAIINNGSLLYQGNMQEFLHKTTSANLFTIELNNPQAGFAILSSHFPVVISNNMLVITLKEKSDSAKAIRLLVEAGCEVYRAEPAENDLEGSFLELLNA